MLAQTEEKILKAKQKLNEQIFEEKQKAKGLVKYKDRWGTPHEVKRWEEIDIGLGNNFADLSPYEFEDFVAKLFQKMGYSTTVTKKTGDFGVDIIAKDKTDTIAIQVKKNKIGSNIGNVTVQQILGAMWNIKANKAIIITTSDFTVQAKLQAKDAPVELWNRKILHEMIRKYFMEAANPIRVKN
jgi:HJR/Mrr/RecB family endonuclease